VIGATQTLLSIVRGALARALLLVFGFSLFVNLLMLVAPLYMLQVFDRVLTSRSVDTLIMLSVLVLVSLMVLALLDIVRNRIMGRVGAWLDELLGQPLLTVGVRAGLDATRPPSVQVLRDLRSVRGFIASPTVFSLLDVPWTPLFLVVVFLLHPVLGWIAAAGALTLLALGILNDVLTRRALQHESDRQIGAMQLAEAAVRSADSVESMGMMPALVNRWSGLSEHLDGPRTRAGRASHWLLEDCPSIATSLASRSPGVDHTFAASGYGPAAIRRHCCSRSLVVSRAGCSRPDDAWCALRPRTR